MYTWTIIDAHWQTITKYTVMEDFIKQMNFYGREGVYNELHRLLKICTFTTVNSIVISVPLIFLATA